MNVRTRKFIGTIATVLYLAVYALIVMAIGGIFVIGRGVVTELAFYIIMGIAWIPGAAVIIRWMSRPDATT